MDPLRRVDKLILGLFVLIGLSIISLPASAQPAPRSIHWEECRPKMDLRARCGKLDVPLDYQQPQKGMLSLNLVVLPSNAEKPAPDPVLVFLGGPGQAATDLAYGSGPWLANLRQKRDIILVDQRGTGGSSGLFCQSGDPALRPLQSFLGELFPVQELKECYAKHHVRSELFTTEVAMRDMDLVRKTLRVERLNLFGGSYGSRAALSYIRQFPNRVRTAILKSPVPMNLILAQNFAPDSQASLDHLVQLCSEDATCHTEFPSFSKEFAIVREKIRNQSVPVELENPSTKQIETVRIDFGLFATTVRSTLYSRTRASRLPFMIHRAYQGDWKPFVQAALGIRQDIDGDAAGVYVAIVCAEDYPFIRKQEAILATKKTFLGTYWLDQISQACASWPTRPVRAQYRQDVRSSVPILLVTGALDPVTPPKYAHTAARYLSNGLVVTFPYGSHALNEGSCEGEIMAAVVTAGTTKNLNTSCVANQEPIKFRTTP